MKKIITLITVLLCLCSCGNTSTSETIEVKCIVEEKYECPAGYKVWISKDGDPTIQRLIEVGKHTYENLSPGDTIVFKY